MGLVLILSPCTAALPSLAQQTPEKVTIDAKAQTTPLPHFWEQMFSSGRANLAMRDSYRQDMRTVKQVTDFRYEGDHTARGRRTRRYADRMGQDGQAKVSDAGTNSSLEESLRDRPTRNPHLAERRADNLHPAEGRGPH